MIDYIMIEIKKNQNSEILNSVNSADLSNVGKW